jgi:hypothetical protein
MGVTTSFFTATIEELEAAAPGWVRPRYGAFSKKEVQNPFTKEPIVVKEFELLSEPPDDCPPDEIHTLIEKERAYAWKLNAGEVEQLMQLMLKASEEEAAVLGRQALLGPGDVENWVFEVPESFVTALAAVKRDEITALAAAWQAKLEWNNPPTQLLEQLVEVATEAVERKKRMFSYVSL